MVWENNLSRNQREYIALNSRQHLPSPRKCRVDDLPAPEARVQGEEEPQTVPILLLSHHGWTQTSHLALRRGRAQGKSHSDFCHAHCVLIMPVSLPGRKKLTVLTICVNVAGWCLIAPSRQWLSFASCSKTRGMCYMPWPLGSRIHNAGLQLS